MKKKNFFFDWDKTRTYQIGTILWNFFFSLKLSSSWNTWEMNTFYFVSRSSKKRDSCYTLESRLFSSKKKTAIQICFDPCQFFDVFKRLLSFFLPLLNINTKKCIPHTFVFFFDLFETIGKQYEIEEREKKKYENKEIFLETISP